MLLNLANGMIRTLFSILDCFQEFLWGYIDFILILSFGVYFTLKSKFYQFRTVIHFKRVLKELCDVSAGDKQYGIKPIKLYFTSIGGSIGLGNIVAIIAVVSIGGPGGLFWMWVSVFAGMLVKYAEVYLGILYREKNQNGGYDGGPMFYLKKAFNGTFIAKLFCFLMCIYGIEIYQFKVVEDVLVSTFSINRFVVLGCLLFGTMYVTLGGVNRLAHICSILMPFFLVTYTCICLWIIFHNCGSLGTALSSVFKSAFTGHAAIGGFAGSCFITTARAGLSNAVYSGDIGMGYDSVIQSETQHKNPEIQARMAIFALLTDCFICTLSVLLVLSTGVWNDGSFHGFEFIVNAFRGYFPHAEILLAVFFFLVGWTTILGFLAVGFKSAKALSIKNGRKIYLVCAFVSFIVFSFVDQNDARLIMYTAGGLLMFINLIAIFKLRDKIKFS